MTSFLFSAFTDAMTIPLEGSMGPMKGLVLYPEKYNLIVIFNDSLSRKKSWEKNGWIFKLRRYRIVRSAALKKGSHPNVPTGYEAFLKNPR